MHFISRDLEESPLHKNPQNNQNYNRSRFSGLTKRFNWVYNLYTDFKKIVSFSTAFSARGFPQSSSTFGNISVWAENMSQSPAIEQGI